MGTIGANIKHLRNEKGLTQKELASSLGVSYQMVQSWERGARNPKRETIEKIASALGVSWLELMPEELLNANTAEGYMKAHGLKPENLPAGNPALDLISGLTETALAPEMKQINEIMQTMNATGRRVAVERVQELAQIPAYQAQPDPGKK